MSNDANDLLKKIKANQPEILTETNELYKYMSWGTVIDKTGNKHNYAKDVLENNQLYMNLPSEFNDPFDCNIALDIKGKKRERERVIKQIYLGHCHRKLSKAEKRYCLELAKMPSENLEHAASTATEKLRTNTRVICLTSCPDNILMWSHYANNHKGICLKLSLNLFSNNYIKPVNYSSEYPHTRYNFLSNKEIKEMRYFTKADDWKYENEYRAVFPNSNMTFAKFKPDSLVAVICGCEMEDWDIKDLIETLKKRETKVILYQAEKKKREFGLMIDKEIGIYGGSKL